MTLELSLPWETWLAKHKQNELNSVEAVKEVVGHTIKSLCCKLAKQISKNIKCQLFLVFWSSNISKTKKSLDYFFETGNRDK